MTSTNAIVKLSVLVGLLAILSGGCRSSKRFSPKAPDPRKTETCENCCPDCGAPRNTHPTYDNADSRGLPELEPIPQYTPPVPRNPRPFMGTPPKQTSPEPVPDPPQSLPELLDPPTGPKGPPSLQDLIGPKSKPTPTKKTPTENLPKPRSSVSPFHSQPSKAHSKPVDPVVPGLPDLRSPNPGDSASPYSPDLRTPSQQTPNVFPHPLPNLLNPELGPIKPPSLQDMLGPKPKNVPRPAIPKAVQPESNSRITPYAPGIAYQIEQQSTPRTENPISQMSAKVRGVTLPPPPIVGGTGLHELELSTAAPTTTSVLPDLRESAEKESTPIWRPTRRKSVWEDH